MKPINHEKVLTITLKYCILDMQTFVRLLMEETAMTENELELMYIIRTSDNPDEALKIAIQTIVTFLEQSESYQEPFAAGSLVLA